MHEASIMQNALQLAATQARDRGATKIRRLHIQVGELSGVAPEALEFAFSALSHGTLAEEAVLEIESVPVTCWCVHCRTEFAPLDLTHECPKCGHISTDLRRGLELELASMEIS